MRYLNISIFIIFIYEVISLSIYYYRVNKNGGKKVDVFKNESPIQKSFLIILLLGTLINMITVLKFSGMLNFMLLQFYLVSKVFRVMTNIHIYEHGISYFGRFIKWQDIMRVKFIENQGIRIEMKNRYKVILIDHAKREKELIKVLKNNY